MNVSVVVLAAGQGSRMHSLRPKVLHEIGGKPLLAHVLDTALKLSNDIHVVVGFKGQQVKDKFTDYSLNWIEQKEMLGTGHAVMQATPELGNIDKVLILYGDVPLVKPARLEALLEKGDLTVLTVDVQEPKGYGRIVRNREGAIEKIVEDKDASVEEKRITEINTGIMAVNLKKLRVWLQQINNNNHQKEYYLTDIIALARKDGVTVNSIKATSENEVLGVNNPMQLAHLEREYQRNQAQQFMLNGVTLLDPNRFDCRGSITFGQDVKIDINVIFSGKNTLGSQVNIGAGAVINNCILADNVEILPYSVLDNAVIGTGSVIGPFSRIRPETVLASQVKIGNFVEIKKSTLDKGSKVSHLSYIGDAELGQNVNIGAGTITCNYDGENKHKTVIKDNVFVGSDTQIVAPVTLGEGVTVGAGTTITKDVAKGNLVISRVEQRAVKDWKRPVKKKE